MGRLFESGEKQPAFFNRLYRNNHDGSFTDVLIARGSRAGYSMGAATADLTTTAADLYVTGVNRNILYQQQRRWHLYGCDGASGGRRTDSKGGNSGCGGRVG